MHPVTPVIVELGDIIDAKPKESHYYLSSNAAEGILRRVKSQKRTLFPELSKALERMVE